MRTAFFGVMLAAAAPAAMAAPAQQLAHRVKAGETLSEIAVKYDTTIEALREANHLSSDLIRSGETLTVPWPVEIRENEAEMRVVVHEVVPTESLGSLAERYHTTPVAIRLYNKLPTDVIKIGQKLDIPVTGAVPKRKKDTYEVEGGDSLRIIGESHALNTHVLRWLNPGVDWKQLKLGQKITVFVDSLEEAPAKATPVKAEDAPKKTEPIAPKASAKAPLPALKVPEKKAPVLDDEPAPKIRPGKLVVDEGDAADDADDEDEEE